MERFQFNTAIAALMELVNDIYREMDGSSGDEAGGARCRSPPSRPPRCCSRSRRTSPRSCTRRSPAGASGRRRGRAPTSGCSQRDTVTVVVQVNGKVRDSIEVGGASTARGRVKRLALERPTCSATSATSEVCKEVVVPGRLVNFVVK